MRITFLGTSSATSYPLAFCNCENCAKARETGGKNFRKRSSIIINDDLLVDMGPDVMTAACMYNKPLTNVRYWLQTHSHSDHFDPSMLSTRAPEFNGVDIATLHLAASDSTLRKMSEMLANEGYVSDLLNKADQQRLKLDVSAIDAYQTIRIGKYIVTAFPANHDSSVNSLLYAITENGYTLFYGTDTDVLSEEIWKEFHQKNLQFNVVILDHTYGPVIEGYGHLNSGKFVEHIQRMKAERLVNRNSKIFATHISHEGNPPHAILSETAAKQCYEIAYDGLVI